VSRRLPELGSLTDKSVSLGFGGKVTGIASHEDCYLLGLEVIYTDNHDSSIVKEEMFGPPFTVLKTLDLDEATWRLGKAMM
jgi:acyl-CoA reductase-like NAD-dependent aldehyde dehydrogenase